jgi:hypothetical protein
MRRGYRNVLVVAFALTGVAAWAGTRAGQTVQSDAVDKLTSATACVASAYHVAPGDNATMVVKNDGGWCWADSNERSYWHIFSANSVAIAKPPKHGHVLVGDLANQNVRVAYRPEVGFAGQDSFTVHSQVNDRDLTYSVTVLR